MSYVAEVIRQQFFRRNAIDALRQAESLILPAGNVPVAIRDIRAYEFPESAITSDKRGIQIRFVTDKMRTSSLTCTLQYHSKGTYY